MPHCVIEFSNQLSGSVTPTQLLRCVFDAHVKSGLFQTEHIKVRCTGYDHHIAGTGSERFIHATSHIMAGRTAEQKQQLSNLIVQSLIDIGITCAAMSAQVVDLDPTYVTVTG
ncbi:MAG: 5-carboxymethyl-2-hydroxymuconate Delta-isomerase [Oceanospirillaceae bacterium]|nr:5-carboxymethyl-2-hydroxymuconate Delta-isomerase [Oceanospirillaceae bacterium]